MTNPLPCPFKLCFAPIFLATQLLATQLLAAEDRSAAIYAEKCASCHGANLTGGNAQSMVDGVWQFGARDGDLTRNIEYGISSVGMPNYGPALSADEIRGLVRFIREAQDKADIEPAPIPTQLYSRDYDVKVATWVGAGLETPWSLTFADANTAFLTELPGRLRIVRNGVLEPTPVSGTPNVHGVGQGGLMDVALDPNYNGDPASGGGWVYLTYAHALARKDKQSNPASMTRVVRGRVVNNKWIDQQLLFEAPPATYKNTSHHYGSRIAFDPQGRLYFSIGERGFQDDAQDPRLPNGKVHRIERNGTIPADNPFANGAEGMRSVFTYGNRNPQGLATHPVTGEVWETEHGPMGGDEVNILKSGANYGWPRVTFGINYNGQPVSDLQVAEGITPPVYYWAPSIAVCGAEFCRGEEFPRWANHLIVGGLGHETLQRLAIVDGRVIYTEQLLKSVGRVRDVAVDPQGAIYVVLNSPDIVLKLTNGGTALRQ